MPEDPDSEPSTVERVARAAHERTGVVTTRAIGAVPTLAAERFATAVSGMTTEPGDVALGQGDLDPLYLTSVLGWDAGPAEADLLLDGNAADPFAGVDVEGLRMMGGGQSLQMHRAPRCDVDIDVETELVSAEVRDARSGPLLVVTVQRRYSDAGGPLLTCEETFLGREAE